MSGAQTVDPAVAYASPIPPAVRRQGARADAIARGIGAANVPDGPAEPPTVVERLPGHGGLENHIRVPENEIRVEPAPAAPAAQIELPLGDAPPAPATPPTDWEQRYRTLEGKYNAEVPALSGQLRQAQQDIDGFRTLIATMTLTHANAAPAAEPAAFAVPQEDVDTYGPELIAAAQRWAAPMVQKLEAKITTLEQDVTAAKTTSQDTKQTLTRNAVHETLDSLVPNWRQIDTDQAYHDWLALVDPFAGQKRHAMLNQAYANGDGNRCAQFYRAFAAEHTAIRATPQIHQPHTPLGAGTIPLADLAAPGRASPTGNPGAPAEKRTFTHKQIQAFYTDVTKGKFANNPADQARLEREIFEATKEGRIR